MKKSNKKLNKQKDILDNDLTSLIESSPWRKVKFELMPKNKLISLRISEELLVELKKKARENQIDYQKFIRLVLEQAV
jgi:predicted DNA binding CopG/RHH family protein